MGTGAVGNARAFETHAREVVGVRHLNFTICGQQMDAVVRGVELEHCAEYPGLGSDHSAGA